MPTRIKICGIRDDETARAACEAGADAVGLVFAPKSPRFVTLDEARVVIDALPAYVEPIGLFVNEPIEEVRDTATTLGLRTVQLHGDETLGEAKELAPLRVTKAVPFREDATKAMDAWRSAPGNVVGVLIDAPPSSVAMDSTIERAGVDGRAEPGSMTGGGGVAFDWRALRAMKDAGELDGLPPLILAGGLTPENVGEAIRLLRPYAVDVSSGVEKSRGVKDISLMRRFCDAVRKADASLSGG